MQLRNWTKENSHCRKWILPGHVFWTSSFWGLWNQTSYSHGIVLYLKRENFSVPVIYAKQMDYFHRFAARVGSSCFLNNWIKWNYFWRTPEIHISAGKIHACASTILQIPVLRLLVAVKSRRIWNEMCLEFQKQIEKYQSKVIHSDESVFLPA